MNIILGEKGEYVGRGWVGEVVEKNVNKQLALLNHLYTKIKLAKIEFDAKINFLGGVWVGGWVGVGVGFSENKTNSVQLS